MGTRSTPVIGNLTMGCLEITTYRNLYPTTSLSHYIKENRRRFIGDCFILRNEKSEIFLKFKGILNNTNSNIHFTKEYSQKKLPFLDILIEKHNLEIYTNCIRPQTPNSTYVSIIAPKDTSK